MCRCRSFTNFLLVAAVVALAGAATPGRIAAGNWRTVNVEQGSFMVEENTRLKDLDPVFQQLYLPDQDMDLKLTSLIQLFPVDPDLFDAGPVKKAKAKATIGGFTAIGEQQSLGSKTKKFDRNGNLVVTLKIPAQQNLEFFFVDWKFLRKFEVPAGTSVSVSTAIETVDAAADPDCFDATTLCLNDDRFKVELTWRDFVGNAGSGVAFPRSDDSGLFFFFDPGNWEMLVKVLDGCNFNGHWWVFAAATTDVEYTLTVTDTVTEESRTYENELGQAAAAVTDTQAFATCP